MRILKQNKEKGKIKLRVEDSDDLWHLYNIIIPEDHVFSLTKRRDEQASDKIREKRAEKKTVYLGIEVEKLEFHEFTDRLRIHGIILREQQDSGSYHTLNIEENTELTIKKEHWSKTNLNRLKEAVKAGKRPRTIMISVDEDEAVVVVLRQYGVQKVGKVNSDRVGKQFGNTETSHEDYFREILTAAKQHTKSRVPLIIGGTGFTKEDLLKFIRENHPDSFGKIITTSTGQSGMVGVNEMLKSGAVSYVTEDSRLEYEIEFVETFLKELATSGKVTYGKKHLENAIDLGAVETVLITDKVLREDRSGCSELLKKAEERGAKVVIVSQSHDSGKQLQSFGGYAAILRYPIS